MPTPRLAVVGSINLDLVASADRMPRPGETITATGFSRVPGGKGANQAVGAARLGAAVTMIGCVGEDSFADEALRSLADSGVGLGGVRRTAGSTGVALIVVDAAGENEIVVVPGANFDLGPDDVVLPEVDGVLCQQEIRAETVERAAQLAPGRFFLNAAPTRSGAPDADLTIVNRYELAALPDRHGVVCVTLGAEGAVVLEDGKEIARAAPPEIKTVDGTGAGDAFTACLVVSLLEGRPQGEALRRACVAGALAASRFGAQSSMPTAEEVDALV